MSNPAVVGFLKGGITRVVEQEEFVDICPDFCLYGILKAACMLANGLLNRPLDILGSQNPVPSTLRS